MLKRIALRLKNIIHDETGPTAVEYAVLMSLIVLVCIGAVRQMSNATGRSFDNSSAAIQEAMGR